jgi:predicted DNA-binding transcriptional regulator AlpA
VTDELNTAAIAAIFGVSRRTVTDRWSKAPDFPKPVRAISRKNRFWRLEDVMKWRAKE